MTITEVNSPKEEQAFLDLVRKIYADDPNFICPLDKDVEATFHPDTNSFFQHGSCTRWILSNKKGEHIGRIAAFVNDKKAYQHEVPTGGIGYFECIDDQKAADVLFDTAKEWLSTKGMKAMDGPINFGENDTFKNKKGLWIIQRPFLLEGLSHGEVPFAKRSTCGLVYGNHFIVKIAYPGKFQFIVLFFRYYIVL